MGSRPVLVQAASAASVPGAARGGEDRILELPRGAAERCWGSRAWDGRGPRHGLGVLTCTLEGGGRGVVGCGPEVGGTTSELPGGAA